jgi:hypothetical protein
MAESARCICSTGPVESESRELSQDHAAEYNRGANPPGLNARYPRAQIELILVPEEEKWLLLASAPIAAKLRAQKKTPVLIALSPEEAEGQAKFLEQSGPFASSCLLIAPRRYPDRSHMVRGPPVKAITTSRRATTAGLLLAKSFWRKTDTVVLASTDEPQAAILGSTLAAHMLVPFIPYERGQDLSGLSDALSSLRTNSILVSTCNGTDNALYDSSLKEKIQFLDSRQIGERIIQLLGAQNIRNMILTRVPDAQTGQGASSWISPYVSVMRGSPLVICSSSDPVTAEEQIYEMINGYSLRPRTLTILADYDSIGVIPVRDEAKLGEYEVSIEPCSGPFRGGAAALGVGRIPFRQLWASSTIIARGFARGLILTESEPRVLMIANPNTGYGDLPLAETISRITAEEFKNLRVKIDEFYRTPSTNAQVLESAEHADLILYEGHLSDQLLLSEPASIFEAEEEYSPEWQYVPFDDAADNLFNSDETHGEPDSTTSDFTNGRPTMDRDDAFAPHPQQDEYGASESVYASPRPRVEQLRALPLIVLQSCHSLEEEVAGQVLRAGGVGLIGSVSNMHSASGSAFIKAFCDGLLYRGETVGDALHDARNYFFCLAELKRKRGHSEMAKVYRAGLSFCLWGDPELRFTAAPVRKPKRPPVSAAFVRPDTIAVTTPGLCLPESETDKYFVRMFPASQLAGIVKRLKNKETRRLMPIYFFRLPVPEGFEARRYRSLQRADDSPNRTVFMVDELERLLYVLYFPAEQTKHEKFELQFIE